MVAADTTFIIDVCARLLGRPVRAIDRIYGGRNSQVFRVDCDTSTAPSQFVAKQYFAGGEDERDRLGTEFRALQLLRSSGITPVPEPIAMDVTAQCAVYEFVPGVRASLQPAADRDIDQAVDFLASLHALARQCAAVDATPASEACFSIDAVGESVAARLTRLRALSGDVPGVTDLHRFLRERVEPFAEALEIWTDEQAQLHHIRRNAELGFDERTLSPSDFGFHNALRDKNGHLVFVDFEYFGWDDPAKTIADFLHHPAMQMTRDQRRAFADRTLHEFANMPGLAARAQLVYPWFGLKWCVILLNEFVPSDLRRRSFAGVAGIDHTAALQRQLRHAQDLLDRVDAEYRNNPYITA